MNKKILKIVYLSLILLLHYSCKNQCTSVKTIELEILKNERVKFKKNKEILSRIVEVYLINEKDTIIQNLKNQINCEDIIKNERGELVFYFKNSTYDSCAIGQINYVYIYTKNEYSSIYSNLTKYNILGKDYILKIYFPDF